MEIKGLASQLAHAPNRETIPLTAPPLDDSGTVLQQYLANFPQLTEQ